MSQENVEVVHQSLTVRGPSGRRRIEDRLLRFPGLIAFAVRRGETLPPRSWLRQRLLRRGIQVGIEALNRFEPERAFALHHRDCEFVPDRLIRTLALEGTRGREDRIRFQQRWNEEWGEFRFEPEEFIDFGDNRGLILGRVKGAGRSSGAGFDGEWAALLTQSDGWVVKEQAFFDHREALEAAGLSE